MQDSDIDLDRLLALRLRVMQILMAALILGCLVFLGIVLTLRQAGNAQNPNPPLLTYMGAGFALLMLVLSLVVPYVTVATSRKQMAHAKSPLPPSSGSMHGRTDAGHLCVLYHSQLIVGAAMLEGATFFCLIAYLVEGELTSLVAAGVLMLFLLARFPTRTRLENFLIEHGELLRQERMSH
jgi:hypothetical protein